MIQKGGFVAVHSSISTREPLHDKNPIRNNSFECNLHFKEVRTHRKPRNFERDRHTEARVQYLRHTWNIIDLC